jgi:HD-GYP domain-containing protein (c-di-GMP phosphodiesterase class II)
LQATRSLAARVVLVADAFDALTAERPYRSAMAVGAAMQEIRANKGTQFCPTVVASGDPFAP